MELLAESVEVPIIPRCLHQGLGRRISSTMAPAAARESMTQICFSGCSSSTISRAMQAA